MVANLKEKAYEMPKTEGLAKSYMFRQPTNTSTVRSLVKIGVLFSLARLSISVRFFGGHDRTQSFVPP
jgi:hypothetical protein